MDYINHRFGKLVVISSRVTRPRPYRRLFVCKCDCGTIKEIRADALKSGRTISCGCAKIDSIRAKISTHNKSKTRLYNIWQTMKQRCLNPNNPRYKYYGAKGVSICEEWMSFIIFYNWAIGNGYNEHLTIDRIDSSKCYEPINCRWITSEENTYLAHKGKHHNITVKDRRPRSDKGKKRLI